MDIYVGNIPYDLEEDTLRVAFSEYGQVDDVKVIFDRATGRSKGFAFVTMPDNDAGTKAIGELDGAEVGGRSIKVNEARPKESEPRKSFSGGGGNRGRR
jgi:RNA recognition motif-containing protein